MMESGRRTVGIGWMDSWIIIEKSTMGVN